MKKSIQTLLLIVMPLFMFGQDTVSYWYSYDHYLHRKKMSSLFTYGGVDFTRTNYAPNGEEYNCMCSNGPKNCCENFTDSEMVCMTVDGKIVADAKVKLNSKPERPEWLISTDSIHINYVDSLFIPRIVKDTILVPALCNNSRAVYGTFQNSGKLVGSEVYFTRKYLERTLEERTFYFYDFVSPQKYGRWADEINNSGKHYYEIISTRWLEDISGCYQLIPLSSD